MTPDSCSQTVHSILARADAHSVLRTAHQRVHWNSETSSRERDVTIAQQRALASKTIALSSDNFIGNTIHENRDKMESGR